MAEQEPLLPDQWLQAHVRPEAEAVCLAGRLEVYFPMTHPRAREQYHKLVDAIASTFGGATVWTGKGAWCPAEVPCDPKDLEQEDVWVITAAHQCAETDQLRRVVEAIREAAEATEQKAVGIRGTSRFYVIPTRELSQNLPQKPA